MGFFDIFERGDVNSKIVDKIVKEMTSLSHGHIHKTPKKVRVDISRPHEVRFVNRDQNDF